MKIRQCIVAFFCLFFYLHSCKKEDSKPQLAQSEKVPAWAPEDTRSITGALAKRGLIKKTEEATPGYVLFQPSNSTETFLIDKDGQVVHRWKGELNSMQSYLLPNSHLIRLERDPDFPTFAAGGQAGILREYDWDGQLVWDFKYATETELIHHDFEVMPNGNILAISYEVISPEDATAAGKQPEHTAKAGIWPDKIIEIQPSRPNGGKIVWQWRMWDHIIQDLDSTKSNYGEISKYPRKININAGADSEGPLMTEEQIADFKKKGFITSNATVDNQNSDISHVNAVAYNEDLDQIVFSSPHLNEIFIIDHGISTEEAKGAAGDLLYRWGNPQNYNRGTKEDQQLFGQHDIKWVPQDFPGRGNLTVFNNDIPDPNSKLPSVWAAIMQAKSPDPQIAVGDIGNYSAVFEITTPINENSYTLPDAGPFGPSEPVWSYTAPDKYSFYSPFVSGAQRLKNGHTFVVSGAQGRFFEINADKQIVWEYWNPYLHDYKLPDGSPPQPTGPFIFSQFRATHFMPDFPAFAGKTLDPIEPQPQSYVLEMPIDTTAVSDSIN